MHRKRRSNNPVTSYNLFTYNAVLHTHARVWIRVCGLPKNRRRASSRLAMFLVFSSESTKYYLRPFEVKTCITVTRRWYRRRTTAPMSSRVYRNPSRTNRLKRLLTDFVCCFCFHLFSSFLPKRFPKQEISNCLTRRIARQTEVKTRTVWRTNNGRCK